MVVHYVKRRKTNNKQTTNTKINILPQIVTKQELEKLFVNFKKLDRNGDGFLSKDEFLQIEALQQNPLVARVLEIFDDDGNDKIDFTEFVSALAIFCSTDPEENKQKVEFAFRIYDVNNDQFISNGDLFRILKIMVGDNLNDTQLQQLVDRTILQADKDKDGKLSPQEFTEVCVFFLSFLFYVVFLSRCRPGEPLAKKKKTKQNLRNTRF